MTSRTDLRRQFLTAHHWQQAAITPLQADASFRRYFRLRQANANANVNVNAMGGAMSEVMLMDAPPPLEDVAVFARVTEHLLALGIRAPKIYAVDAENGFALLEDLGDSTFTRLLDDGHEKVDEYNLYRRAIDLLAAINRHPRAIDIALPQYDSDAAAVEANLFVDWYLPARMQKPIAADARAAFVKTWHAMINHLPPLDATLVLRDFHVDNLMLVGGKNEGDECAVLDYQDALIGSAGYDLVSLLEDARRDVGESLAAEMFDEFVRQTAIDKNHLRQHCIVWGAQRHCKVAGIFTRLWLRDGKDAYLRHLPRVMHMLKRRLDAPALSPVRDWLVHYFGDIDHVAHAPFDAPPAQLIRHCDQYRQAKCAVRPPLIKE